MSSAICFNFEQSKILLSGNGLYQAGHLYNEIKDCSNKGLEVKSRKTTLIFS